VVNNKKLNNTVSSISSTLYVHKVNKVQQRRN